MLQNEYMCLYLQESDFDTAENEPRQVCCMIRAREPSFGIVSGLAAPRLHKVCHKPLLFSEGVAYPRVRCVAERSRKAKTPAASAKQPDSSSAS